MLVRYTTMLNDLNTGHKFFFFHILPVHLYYVLWCFRNNSKYDFVQLCILLTVVDKCWVIVVKC